MHWNPLCRIVVCNIPMWDSKVVIAQTSPRIQIMKLPKSQPQIISCCVCRSSMSWWWRTLTSSRLPATLCVSSRRSSVLLPGMCFLMAFYLLLLAEALFATIFEIVQFSRTIPMSKYFPVFSCLFFKKIYVSEIITFYLVFWRRWKAILLALQSVIFVPFPRRRI